MKTDATAPKRTVLAIIGSMRRMGNCELFVKAVSENIPVEHELALVRLPSLNILPCRGCYACVTEGTCRIRDDIPFLIDRIVSSDALIIASPVYFLGTHASVKAPPGQGLLVLLRGGEDREKAVSPRQYLRDGKQDRHLSPDPSRPGLFSRPRGKGKRQPACGPAGRDPGNEEAPRMRIQARQASLRGEKEEKGKQGVSFLRE